MSAPLTYGNKGIARRRNQGRMIAGLYADSIYNYPTVPYMMRNWRTRAGVLGTGGPAGFNAQLATATTRLAGGTELWMSGVANDVGAAGGNWMFCKSSSAYYGMLLTGIGSSLTDNGFHSLGIYKLDAYIASSSSNTYGLNQNWFQSKALTYSLLYLNNSTDGFSTFGFRATNVNGNLTFGTNAALSATGTTGTFSTSTLTISSQAYTGSNGGPSAMIIGTALTNYTSKVLRVAALKIVDTSKLTSGNGFMLCPMTAGGTSTGDWADTTYWSQAAMDAYVQFMGIDTIIIALGQNDTGQTKATYKTRMNALIDRFLISNPNMHFVLISMYQSDPASYWTTYTNSSYKDFADALYEITQARAGYCLFLNQGLFMARGTSSSTDNYNMLKYLYITDTVHMGDVGRNYLTNCTDALFQIAEAECPSVTLTHGSFLKA